MATEPSWTVALHLPPAVRLEAAAPGWRAGVETQREGDGTLTARQEEQQQEWGGHSPRGTRSVVFDCRRCCRCCDSVGQWPWAAQGGADPRPCPHREAPTAMGQRDRPQWWEYRPPPNQLRHHSQYRRRSRKMRRRHRVSLRVSTGGHGNCGHFFNLTLATQRCSVWNPRENDGLCRTQEPGHSTSSTATGREFQNISAVTQQPSLPPPLCSVTGPTSDCELNDALAAPQRHQERRGDPTSHELATAAGRLRAPSPAQRPRAEFKRSVRPHRTYDRVLQPRGIRLPATVPTIVCATCDIASRCRFDETPRRRARPANWRRAATRRGPPPDPHPPRVEPSVDPKLRSAAVGGQSCNATKRRSRCIDP
ncbi:unnamed protein product [Lampetra fluviatilis]